MDRWAQVAMLKLQLASAEERAATWERIAGSEEKRAQEAEAKLEQVQERLDANLDALYERFGIVG